MADVFTNDLRIREQESGSNAGTWGGLLNTTIRNIASAFGQGSETIPNASTHTITLADGVADEARSLFLKCTGGGQACTVTLAPNTVSKVWIISNETSFTLTFSAGSGANVAVAAGAVKVIVTDGAGSGAAVVDAFSGLDASLSGLTVDTNTLVVDATNNRVGIGTTSINNKLTLADTTDCGIQLTKTGSISVRVAAVAGAMAFGVDGSSGNTERMRINSGGNLLIGRSSDPYADGNNVRLHVEGALPATDGRGQVAIATTAAYNATDRKAMLNFSGAFDTSGTPTFLAGVAGEKENTTNNNYGGALTFHTRPNGGNFAERMRIDSSGNVGIGTSSPSYKLHISEDSAGAYVSTIIANTNAGGYANLILQCGSAVSSINYAPGIFFAVGPTGGDTTTPIVFRNNNATERMRIDSSGNLLVGTTSSSQSVGEGSKFVSNGRLFQVSSYDANTQESLSMYSTGAGAFRFFVGWGGTVYATNTSISAVSDQRLKENIRDLDVGLDAVLALKPRKFDWKEGKGKDIKDDRGFVAQEFEEIFPDLIDEWKDPVPEGEEPYKSVRQDLIPVLVKAIQEQQVLIEQLQAEVAALKGAN